MNIYDKAGRFAALAEPTFVVARVAAGAGLSLTFREWYPHRSVPLPAGPEREADLVALADEPAPEALAWLLVFEVQARHDPDKAAVLLHEASTYLVYARDTDRQRGLRPLPVFVYLQGRAPGGGEAGCWTPGGRGFGCRPALWEVADDPAAGTLDAVEAGRSGWGAARCSGSP